MIFDSDGNFFVADSDNHRVQKFNSTGVFQGWLGGCTSGANCDIANQHSNGFSCTASTCIGSLQGSGIGQFADPWYIAIDSNDIPHIAYTRIESTFRTITYENRVGGCMDR